SCARPATAGGLGSAGCSSSAWPRTTCCGSEISRRHGRERPAPRRPAVLIPTPTRLFTHGKTGETPLVPPFFHSLLAALDPLPMRNESRSCGFEPFQRTRSRVGLENQDVQHRNMLIDQL